MSTPAMTVRRERRDAPSGLIAFAALAAVTAAALLWSKWLPYGDKLQAVVASERWADPSVLDEAGRAGSSPSLAGGWSFTTAYFADVWKAIVAALVIGAALQALVPTDWLARARGREAGLRGALAGGVLGLPFLMCTACAAPVAVALRRQGASTATTLGYAIGSPVLNPAVLVFIAVLGPWQWVATRIVVGIVLVLGLVALVARGAPDEVLEQDAPSTMDVAVLHDAPKRFVARLVRLTLTLIPLYVVTMLVFGVFRGWLFPLDATTGIALALLVAVTLGTLIDLPTAGEVPVLLALSAAGMHAGVIGALLITLPAISFVTMTMLAPSHTVRTTLAAAGAVAASGLLAAGMLGVLSA